MSQLASRIDSVDVVHHEVGLPNSLQDATQTIDRFEYVLVHLSAGDHKGTGWAYTTGFGGAAVADLVRECLVEVTLGRAVGEIRDAWGRGRAALDRGGYGNHASLALGAVDIARWDLAARTIDEPLYALLGGSRRRCATYGSGVDLGDSPAELADRVHDTLEAGYPAVKIKLGGDPAVNRQRLRAVRGRIGHEVPLFVDANTAWTRDVAQRHVDDLTHAQVAFLEEPFPIEDAAAYRAFSGTAGIPLAGGETAHSASTLLPYVNERLLGILQPDICRIGGITEWLRIAHAAEIARVPLTTHFTIELAAHLAAAVPGVRYVEITDHNLTHLGLVRGGVDIGPGWIQPIEDAGHGLEWAFPADSIVSATTHADPTRKPA